jgi:hypothetical protein
LIAASAVWIEFLRAPSGYFTIHREVHRSIQSTFC